MTTATLSEPTTFLWLEITGRCQLHCVHCESDSGPLGSHGLMRVKDWFAVIDQAAATGVRTVQFIGGEPTTHPHLPDLIRHALAAGLDVEVFSNLYRVTPAVWAALALPGVSLATSYYSDDPAQHDAITTRAGSHARSRANIAEALRLGIPIRVGIIGMTGEQRVEQARTELLQLGVSEANIGYDQVRAFGRAAVKGVADEADSCGQCGHGTAAILPDGTVTPCVFTRARAAGSVLDSQLGDIIGGMAFAEHVDQLDQARGAARGGLCGPDRKGCNPFCYPNCKPASLCNPANR